MAINMDIINEIVVQVKICKIMKDRIDQNNFNKIISTAKIQIYKKKSSKNALTILMNILRINTTITFTN